MKQIGLLWHSVRYTRKRQLVYRLRLRIKRMFLQKVGPAAFRNRTNRYSQAVLRNDTQSLHLPKIAAIPPAPVFPPRKALYEELSGKPHACFLNMKWPLLTPLDWHPPEWEFGTRLELLNLHYMEYLEAVGDKQFETLVEDWIRNNPAYRLGYWLDDWNCYSMSIRCVVWMQQWATRQERLCKTFKTLMLASLYEQMLFLEKNVEFDIGGNHLIKNIRAFLWAACFFDGTAPARWRACGERLLKRELDEQILSDGVHYERSPAYHCQVFADLLGCHVALKPGEFKDSLERALEKMAQAISGLTHPDGEISLFNDAGLNMTYSPGQCLSAWETLSGRTTEKCDTISFPDAGYFGIRSGENMFLWDCGKIAPDFLPAHGHGDLFSFEWDINEKRIVVDTGVFQYHPGEMRSYSRSTSAHNTVEIDGQDQCEFWKAFRVGRRAEVQLMELSFRNGTLKARARHDGYSRLAGKPLHERCIESDASQVHVEDKISGGDGQPVKAYLVLHPECTATVSRSGLEIERGDIRIDLHTNHTLSIVDAWYFPDFGVKRKTSKIVLDYGSAPCCGGFVLRRI